MRRNHGSVSQSLTLSASTYMLQFKAAQRGSGNDSYKRMRVTFRKAKGVSPCMRAEYD